MAPARLYNGPVSNNAAVKPNWEGHPALMPAGSLPMTEETMNEAVRLAELAFEDAELPAGVEMRPIRPAIIPIEAYVSPEYAAQENQRLWSKVWQAACRMEDIPKIGDYVSYDIMEESVIIVRTTAETVQAFYNVCQHRGRQLTTGSGNATQFICRFHGWRWRIDGETAFVNDRKRL